jgi:hypothetical protein
MSGDTYDPTPGNQPQAKFGTPSVIQTPPAGDAPPSAAPPAPDLPWRARVVRERQRVAIDLNALGAFLRSPRLSELSQYQQSLLRAQEGVMTAYVLLLDARLAE